jgi:hypothetical protein
MTKFRLCLCGVAVLSLIGCMPLSSADYPIQEGFAPNYRPPPPPAPLEVAEAPALADPNALADYAGHTNQDYETAERICGDKGTYCRHEEADKLRDARREREPARKPPCDGITADDVRDIETRFPRTMNGVPAMPVAVSKPYVSSVNGEPTCAAEMIVTFGEDVGYNYVFLVERRPDRLHLEPVYDAGLRNPPPIRLYH